MPIRLYAILNTTPDSVQSKGISDEQKENIYIWKFRNQDENGLDVIVSPIQIVDSTEVEWELNIHDVEWTGDDYIRANKPLHSKIYDDLDKAISCADDAINNICKNNSEYNHIL